MGKGKTRHREYIDAIKHTKKRLQVGMDYQPYLVCRALWKDETIIPHINNINRKPIKTDASNIKDQRLFEKQMHFDYLLSVVKQTPI